VRKPQGEHTSVRKPQGEHTSVRKPQGEHTSVRKPQGEHTSVRKPQGEHALTRAFAASAVEAGVYFQRQLCRKAKRHPKHRAVSCSVVAGGREPVTVDG